MNLMEECKFCEVTWRQISASNILQYVWQIEDDEMYHLWHWRVSKMEEKNLWKEETTDFLYFSETLDIRNEGDGRVKYV